MGIDIHPRESDRPLFLGGVRFKGEPGLAGHSDADVICHALGDALLGAAGLGDLGEHFPDTDPVFAGMAGLDLLGRCVGKLAERGDRPVSCDLTVLADRPPLSPRRGQIVANLASVLGVDPARVSVKATRPEGLGLSGDGAACVALAVVESQGP